MADIRLNLGAGDKPLEGYINLDRKTGQEIYPLANYADESVDEVRASHVLEHFDYEKAVEVLAEWVRVLKPNGVLKIAVPNFETVARAYLAGHEINVQGLVMGGHQDANDAHRAIFDNEVLSQAMRSVGLYDVRPWQSETNDCASLPVSLNLQGRKKGPLPKLKIACAMSVPRLGFQDNFFCWASALMPLGITPTKYDGAFWGQCLERVMETQIDADWILTVDYDSVFTRETVEHLIRIASVSDADAIAPLQIMRGGKSPLLFLEDANAKNPGFIRTELFKQEIVKVKTAHFGLTLLRTEALKKMPHPWFLGVPNSEGRWHEGRTDDDIYFWRKWESTGNSACIASYCLIGHAQLMVTWPGKDFQPVHQHSAEFWQSGMPDGVWS